MIKTSISKVNDLLIKFVKNDVGNLPSRLTNSLNTEGVKIFLLILSGQFINTINNKK
jgi:hypothetical protein